MFRGELSFGFITACGVALLSVGCIGNKNKNVAVEPEAAPPAAAYPDTPGYADNSAPTMTPTAPAPSRPSAPAATTSAPSAPAFELREGEKLVEYQIQSGDTLEKIANEYNTSYRRIMAANGMTSDRIIAGKSIQVPTSAPPSDVAMNTPAQSGSSSSSSINPPPVTPSAPSSPATTGNPYPSTTASPSAPSINVPNNPSSTSYPRVPNPTVPSQPATSFPTPSFGGSQ